MDKVSAPMTAMRGMMGGKEGDGFGRQRVDTRSVCLGQTGNRTVLVCAPNTV